MDKSANSPAWQRSAGKNPEGGLNAKGRASYNKSTGGNLKPPVTESDPKGDRAKRQNSFCSRMCGMKRKNTGSDAKKDPDSRINKSLRKWNCKCSSALEFGEKLADAGQAALNSAVARATDMENLGNAIGLLAPTAIGAFGGALTSRKGKRLAGAARGAGIGAAYTVGSRAGNALGGAVSSDNAVARFGGGLGGGVSGALLAANLLPEIEDKDEKQAMTSMTNTQSAFAFGQKFATVTLADAPEHKDDKGVDVNPVAAGTPEGKETLTKKKVPVKAEDVVTENKAANFGRKLAGSLVNFVERKPRDLTKGTLNPHAAGEEPEEVPAETTNEPVNAQEFGAKMGFDLANLTGNVPPKAPEALPPSLLDPMPGRLSRYATENGPVIPGQPLPPTAGAPQNLDLVKTPGMLERVYQSYMDGSKQIGEYWGPKVDAASRAVSSLAVGPEAFTGPPSPKAAPKAEVKAEPAAKPEPVPNAPTEPSTPKAEGGSYMPLAVGGGLGAAGLAALVYYLMNQQKGRKRREEEELAV